MLENSILGPAFAPVFRSQTQGLLLKGRSRMTDKLVEIRKLCHGSVAEENVDFYREYFCSYKWSHLHSCSARFIFGTSSSQLLRNSGGTVPAACEHHRHDTARGYVHRTLQDFSAVRTPEGLVHKTFDRASSVAVLSQSRAFGYQTTEAARKAASRHRRRQFHKGVDLTQSVLIEAKRSALEDLKGDTQILKKFHGGVHDISLFDTGELRSVSIYWNLGLALLAIVGHATNTYCRAFEICVRSTRPFFGFIFSNAMCSSHVTSRSKVLGNS